MESRKSIVRKQKASSESHGDRRTGSVGERPELAASASGGDRRSGTAGERKTSIEDEITDTTVNDPGLGGG